MKLTSTLLAFNRGLVSRKGLARVDVKRIASLSAETMTNFIPTILGSMSIRPGWRYLGATRGNLAAKLIPFVFSVDDTALVEVTTGFIRVWRNDELITRVAVGTGITNGTFTTDLTGWTDNDEVGATSSWLTGNYLQLLGDGTNAAIRDQEVTVSGGDAGDVHALTVIITKGPVSFRVGSSQGADDYVTETSLDTGTHSLSLTPTGNFHIRFFSRLSRPVLVDSVAVEATGVMTVAAPWSATDLDNLRWDQSGDIIFVACEDVHPYKIERRSAESWSVVKYETDDGPFLTENTTAITLTPSAITGTITVTASKAFFRSSNVGSLFSFTSEGQVVTASISAQNTFTDAIRITGVDSSRVFTIIISGTWSATVRLQRSLESDEGPWEDVSTVSWTANTTETFDDGLDNQIAWYRIGVKTGGYTSGTVVASLDYALGAITGVVRVTAYTSSVSVTADVLSDLGGTDATELWAEGAWSSRRGYPTAVAIHEGRLWWAGKSKVWGSITDAYDSFDPDFEGDAGPISRSLGVGPVDRINWIFSSSRLLMGGDLNEYTARSSSLDEPLTPSAFSVKVSSSQGSAPVMPGRVDSKAVFVNRTAIRVFENVLATNDYQAVDLCQLVPDIGDPEIVRLAVQRQPDTRIHAIRSDGTVGLLVFDRAEDVQGWCEIETDGDVEDAAVLPAQAGVTDDYVYYIVKRTINGATVRYLEKWAQANEGIGGLGAEGATSPYSEYSSYEVVQTDTVTGGVCSFQFNESNDKIYVGGSDSGDIYIHEDVPFTQTPVQVDATDAVMAEEANAVLSVGGLYYWLSGRDDGSPDDSHIRVLNTTTNVLTDMGLAFAGSSNFVIAATDSPLRVWVGNGPNIAMYAPNIGTGSLGGAVWTQNNGANFDFGAGNAYPLVWDDHDNLYWGGGAKLIQFKAFTGDYVIHNYPTFGFGSPGGRRPAWDTVNQKLFQSFGGPSEDEGYIYELTGLNTTTPTANSGTWTLRFTIATPGVFYGMGMSYDPQDDILFVVQPIQPIGGVANIYRYWANPRVLLDTVTISDVTPSADIYPYYPAGFSCLYREGHGYLHASGNGGVTDHLIKLNYQGAEILVDPAGTAVTPGGTVGRLNALVDSYVEYTGVEITAVTGLSHLEGETVAVWGGGADLGTDDDYEQTFTVASGQITLTTATTNITVGLPYTAQFKSAKLGLQTQTEVLFGKDKRIVEIALVLSNTHHKGLRFGPDFDNLDDRPQREEWANVAVDTIDVDYDREAIQFPSTWSPDTRICIQAQSPRPCTVLAVQVVMEV